MSDTDTLRTAALASKAWPYEEARKLIKRWPDGKSEPVLFQTGYGPSGLPHIGTFTEVARTSMVRNAYAEMTGHATRLVAFSDDMDGMRKVPGNLPEQDMLLAHLDLPLSRVPDPFGTHESFAAHNNARLRSFLDQFGFDYEFIAASQAYVEGRFDETLKSILRHYDKIMAIMLPTLGEERRKTYSPIFPIHPETGKVLQVPITVIDAEAGTIAYADPETGAHREQSVLGGLAKAQWKVDWALRWVAFSVDYEMAGKDLIDSVTQSGKIARALGATPPDGFNYEMFLDEHGAKISKTKGNGLTIEEWLTYAPIESLAFYIYREPRKARALSFSVIPRAVDEYYQFLAAYPTQPIEQQLGNPVHHVHLGRVPAPDMPITFGLMLNLVSVAMTEDKALLWRYVQRYAPALSPETHPAVDRLLGYAVAYFRDFVAATLHRRAPTDQERAALADLDARFAALPGDADAETIQNEVYEAGKAAGFEPLRDWFKALYETLLGSSQGPRMGSFAALYGLAETRALISDALARQN
ncbi:lysine--tRNA ligase [Sphingomonas abietis]|uniref:Lysine--tRNA ligase n=1 Tax=Sphingomonas abietis TaxID=3012344 RepID=A0ABY7NTH8_9SPHN|nr:lysine--tRNA ligase [Sphingomonas abietis]WBO22761.1 lysine--tRNA ligase [Sphingomonas abietis]